MRAGLLGGKTWKGLVNANGTKGSTGPFTIIKLGTGNYRVAVDVAGLGLPTGYGLFSATPYFCTGGQATTLGAGYSLQFSVMTSISIQVATTTAAGAATDCAFFFTAPMPDADSGSPVPPFIPAARVPDASCTSMGGVTTCVQTMPR